MLPLGTSAPDFSLPDTTADMKTVSLGDFAGKPLVVMFICNHCPFVKHIAEKLGPLAQTFATQGAAVVGISSNDASNYPADAPEKMTEEAQAQGWTFAYLYDESQAVAKAYRAACTPDFYVFDRDHKLAYRGQFDDSRPGNGVPVTGSDLAAAVDAVIKGDSVGEAQKPSIGCNIKWIPGKEPDYFLT
jgi:peroxiredoxin